MRPPKEALLLASAVNIHQNGHCSAYTSVCRGDVTTRLLLTVALPGCIQRCVHIDLQTVFRAGTACVSALRNISAQGRSYPCNAAYLRYCLECMVQGTPTRQRYPTKSSSCSMAQARGTCVLLRDFERTERPSTPRCRCMIQLRDSARSPHSRPAH